MSIVKFYVPDTMMMFHMLRDIKIEDGYGS